MFWCDGLECHDHPLDGRRSGPKNHIFEFRRFREVDRGRAGVTYERTNVGYSPRLEPKGAYQPGNT